MTRTCRSRSMWDGICRKPWRPESKPIPSGSSGGENYTLTAADLTHFITTRNAWEGYIFAYDEETSGIVMRLDHYHCVCGGNTAVGDHTSHIDMGWAPWAGTDDLPCNYNSVIYSTIKDGYWYLTDDVTLDRGVQRLFLGLHAPLPARQNDHADGKRLHKDHQGRADNHRLHGTGQDRLPEGRHRGRKKNIRPASSRSSEARSGAAPTEIPTGPASGS